MRDIIDDERQRLGRQAVPPKGLQRRTRAAGQPRRRRPEEFAEPRQHARIEPIGLGQQSQ